MARMMPLIYLMKDVVFVSTLMWNIRVDQGKLDKFICPRNWHSLLSWPLFDISMSLEQAWDDFDAISDAKGN
jgi:hypothetical protein